MPQAQQASRSVLVKVTLPKVPSAKPLLPGMFGRVEIPVGTVERLFVPRPPSSRSVSSIWSRWSDQTERSAAGSSASARRTAIASRSSPV